MSQLIVLAAEQGPGATPYVIAGTVFIILAATMLALLAFGKGREHS